jgi:hypothetical protein
MHESLSRGVTGNQREEEKKEITIFLSSAVKRGPKSHTPITDKELGG